MSQVGTLIGFLITAFAPNLWILFLARAIDGSTAGNLSLAQAYISDVTKPEERAKSFGIIGIAFGMGFLIGPAISGFLAGYDYRYPILRRGVSFRHQHPGNVAAAAFGQAGREKATGPGGARISLVQWGAYAEYFRQTASGRAAVRVFRLRLQLLHVCFRSSAVCRAPPHLSRDAFRSAATGLRMGLRRIPGHSSCRVRRRWAAWSSALARKPLLRAGFAGYAAGYVILALCHSLPVLIAATVVTSIGGLVRPTLTSLITQATSREEQGVVLGLTQSLTSVAQICAPPLGGYLIERGLLTGWGLVAAAVAALGLALAYRSLTPDVIDT